jgi:hypothetical protein
MDVAGETVARWLTALERRYLSDLTFQEIRRGLVALSTWYVAHRSELGRGVALAGAGKRAAFALFYAPLHLLLVRHVVRTLDAVTPPPRRIVDLGCGSGAASGAWALEAGGRPAIAGYDVDAWAIVEARWTWSQLGLRGHAQRRGVERAPGAGVGEALLAAWVVNELNADARRHALDLVIRSAQRGARVLVIEPIARTPVPWWDEWHERLAPHGGHARTWRVPVELPDIVARLDRAAGLDHRELTARSLYVAAGSGRR